MIPPQCQDKISQLGGNDSIRTAFTELFNAISADAEAQELPSATLILPCYDEDSELQPGDWAPEIHLVVRKVESANNDNETDEDSAEESQA